MRRRRRSRSLHWLCSTGAPWALAAGLLVSFTASAGQNRDISWSTAMLASASSRAGGPQDADFISFSSRGLEALSRVAHLGPTAGDIIPREIDPFVSENPPRAQMKARSSGRTIEIDRTNKADPLLALKPSLGAPKTSRDLSIRRVMFHADEELTASLFAPGLDGAEWDNQGFTPTSQDQGTTSRVAGGHASPLGGGGGGTGGGHRSTAIVSVDGATPATPKAMALSSTTPAPADATPVEIAAAPVSLPPPGAPAVASLRKGNTNSDEKARQQREDATRPAYASLIDPQAMSREQRCLAEAVYFEARSESEEGQAAVAQVVLNRVKSGLYPSTVCGVVYQNRHRYLACQFSFACEGKSLRITEPGPWAQAVRVAREVTEGKTYLADVGGATHYHADYVQPYWAKRLKKMDVIGRHVFYKLRPGQT